MAGRVSRLLRSALMMLPGKLGEGLLRRQAHLPGDVLAGLRVSVATDEAAYLAAFRVVHDAYVQRGWIHELPERMWLTPHHVLPESTILVVSLHGEVVGTVALIEDSTIGLPIDHTFGPETRPMRQPGRRLVEMGSMAVAPHVRGFGPAIVMMVSAWRYAAERLRATDIVVAISSSQEKFYGALFHFERYAPIRNYEGFGESVRALVSDPVAALRAEVASGSDWAQRHWPEPPSGRINLASLLREPFPAPYEHLPDGSLGRSELVRYKLPRSVFQNLFLRETRLVAKLDPATKEYLLRWRTQETVEGDEGHVSPTPSH